MPARLHQATDSPNLPQVPNLREVNVQTPKRRLRPRPEEELLDFTF